MAETEGWKSREIIDHYQRTADITIPHRREILSRIAALATAFCSNSPGILDLGCGSGDVIAEILRLKPGASVCGVDYSEGMIHLVRERFQNESNIEIFPHDLNSGIPGGLLKREFDAVTSCFAVHHIEYENRVKLYTQINDVLAENGLFVYGDIVIRESPTVGGWELDNLVQWITEQAKSRLGIERTYEQVKKRHLELAEQQGDKPGTLREMQEELRQAGFRYVDCVWMESRHAIVVASNR